MTGDQDEYLTVGEIAEILRMSRSTAYRLVRAKELGHIRVGRNIRVPERSFRDFLENAAPAPPPEPGNGRIPPARVVTIRGKGDTERLWGGTPELNTPPGTAAPTPEPSA
jgi:excisionase family DNA binding protein